MDGLDTSKDGGAFSAAPPPVDGLGNYKGVMLCNRPVEDAPVKMRGGTGDGNPPFKSTISPSEREEIGLTPCTKLPPRQGVKTRGPSAALRRHVQWIRELEGQVKEDKGRMLEDAQIREERQLKMQDFFKKQRDAIKELKRSKNIEDIHPRELETLVKFGATAGAPKKRAGATSKKPKWAMTQEETEDVEDEEAADLIRFAENLDFDKYVADAEFRQCLMVLHDRANRIHKEQDAFKDALVRDFNAEADADEFGSVYSGPQDGIDGTSLIGDVGAPGAEYRRRTSDRGDEDRPDWDTSTACGEERRAPDKDVKSAVDKVFESASHLKGVHSKESMQRIIEKTMENTAADE